MPFACDGSLVLVGVLVIAGAPTVGVKVGSTMGRVWFAAEEAAGAAVLVAVVSTV